MFKSFLINYVRPVAETVARRAKVACVALGAMAVMALGSGSAHAVGAVDLTPIVTEVTDDVSAALTIIIPVVALIWGARWAMKALRAIK